VLHFEDDRAGVARQHGVPAAGRNLDHAGVLAQLDPLGDVSRVVEGQNGETPAQGSQHFPSVRVTVRQNQGVRLHRDGEALDGIA